MVTPSAYYLNFKSASYISLIHLKGESLESNIENWRLCTILKKGGGDSTVGGLEEKTLELFVLLFTVR